MLTLWDLLKPVAGLLQRAAGRPGLQSPPATAPAKVRRPRRRVRKPDAAAAGVAPAHESMAPSETSRAKRSVGRTSPRLQHYEQVVRTMLSRYDIRVRRWRKSMSGVAWTLEYRDGRVVRLLESPKPRSPLSMSIFLHEVGHHALGIGAFKPRCLEEYHAWMFALRTMEQEGLAIDDRVRTRVDRSLRYAVAKAKRRGLRDLPVELAPYAHGRPERATL